MNAPLERKSTTEEIPSTTQRKGVALEKKRNKTGLPDQLKSGIENLSGHSMDDVKVHYNSSKPAQLQAHAYAQGNEIHLSPGQERHLPHEAWHVVQQKEGRVRPTMQLQEKVNINDDESLEKEADVMGAKAARMPSVQLQETSTPIESSSKRDVAQRMIIRIRDVAEMVGIAKPTIMNASKITSKAMSGKDEHLEDVGISKALKGRNLENGEELRIVAHGSLPSIGSIIRSGLPRLGGFEPAQLAEKLAGLFPDGYRGAIYLNGCYTATRLDFNSGTSYIELFAEALSSIRKDMQFTVSGNLGPAATLDSGEELITLDPSVARLAKAKNWPVIEREDPKTHEMKYQVVSPFGMGYASSSGNYNDMGLTEIFLKKKMELERELELAQAERDSESARQENFSRGITSINGGDSEGNIYINNGML